ncbi:MAG: hypothetical protein GC178_01550 [Flavobacteriales bacterium]|nr:hypothetical protein [Flavobacteriales bacterium]
MKAYENNLDVFASVFKRSLKHHFRFEGLKLNKMMVVADEKQLDQLDAFAETYCDARPQFVYDEQFDWNRLKNFIGQEKPDVILIQRFLGIHAEGLRFSIGPILESITQELNIPVLILPKDRSEFRIRTIGIGFDHQIDNSNLVNRALLMSKFATALQLIHIEDESIFNYYMDAIAKIPGINTEYASKNIRETILDLSGDFFSDVKEKLATENLQVTARCSFGNVAATYDRLVSENNIDLLVFEAEDDSKLAMHSLGQSLTIQFPEKAVLLV